MRLNSIYLVTEGFRYSKTGKSPYARFLVTPPPNTKPHKSLDKIGRIDKIRSQGRLEKIIDCIQGNCCISR